MNRRCRQISSTKASCWQAISPLAGEEAPQKTIDLDGAAVRQTIDGFGGCFNELGHMALCTAAAETQQRVMEELFSDKGCGFSLCRMPVGANDFSTSYYSFNEVRNYFNNGVSSYIYWNLILDEFGLSNWGWRQNSLVSVDKHTGEAVYNPELYVMKHFSHFVRPGACRLESGDPDVLVFRNPDGAECAVLANESPAAQAVEFVRKGQAMAVTLPPGSVNTVVFPRIVARISNGGPR